MNRARWRCIRKGSSAPSAWRKRSHMDSPPDPGYHGLVEVKKQDGSP